MPFTTKLDFTNRQAKQYQATNIALSGKSSFGLCYSALTTGPDLTTTGTSFSDINILSDFTGTTGTTTYVFPYPLMYDDVADLSALTPSNSATTQTAGPNWRGYDMFTTVDGFTGYSSYSAVSYDINVSVMTGTAGTYSGYVWSDLTVFSASSLDWTGDTIWNDVSGYTRTKGIIISNGATNGYVLTCNDTDGKAIWAPSSGISADTNTFITGSTLDCVSSILRYTRNDAVNIDTDLTCLAFSGGSGNCITDLYVTNVHGCSPITIHDEVQSFGSTATGTTSFGFGFKVKAWGNYSQAWGDTTIASGYASHAEGENTVSTGTGSHSEGSSTSATTNGAHAEGSSTLASGIYSHAEGNTTTATEDSAHSEGNGTTASGAASHAEGGNTTASNSYAHAEGFGGTASGAGSHVEGFGTLASGDYSHAAGSSSSATTFYGHAIGRLNITNAIGGSVGGSGNTITVTSDYSAIAGSINCIIDASSDTAYGSFIGGAMSSEINKADYAFIGGATSCLVGADNSAIVGGISHVVNSNYSAIMGGSANTVNLGVERAVVLGGEGISATTSDTVFVPYLNVQSNKGISFGTGNTRVHKEIEIGDWDMDATSAVTITHSLSGTEWKTVRDINVIIRNDGDTTYYSLDNSVISTPTTSIDSSNFNLARDLAGNFDTTDFDSTTYNRGFISFWYTPD